MSDPIAAALIAAVASVISSVLTFILGIHSMRRSAASSSQFPFGALVESHLARLEAQLDRIEASFGDMRFQIRPSLRQGDDVF